MKNLLALFLSIIIALGLSACSVGTLTLITEEPVTVTTEATTHEKETLIITTRPTTTDPETTAQEVTAKETTKANTTREAETTTVENITTQKSESNENVINNSQSSYVYWVSNGTVYHLSQNCRTLSKSKNIRSGTTAQSGRSKVCKVCG